MSVHQLVSLCTKLHFYNSVAQPWLDNNVVDMNDRLVKLLKWYVRTIFAHKENFKITHQLLYK